VKKVTRKVFLILLALVLALSVGLAACAAPAGEEEEEEEEEETFDLTIYSTEGGNVTGPGEGIFTYDAGTAVHLMADAEEGYHFVDWTGDVGTIDYVYDAATTIIMDANHSITANFEAISATQYTLTISISSPSEEYGSVTSPGVGTWTYDEGTEVNLVAMTQGYYDHFINWTGDVDSMAGVYDPTTTIIMNGNYSIAANFGLYMVSADFAHTVGLKSNGTVVATGLNDDNQCEVGSWTNVRQIDAGGLHTVGIGCGFGCFIIHLGSNSSGQADIINKYFPMLGALQVSGGGFHTVALHPDGGVVAAGDNSMGSGQCNVLFWGYITQVSAGWGHTVGLETDGTVVAVGLNDEHQCDVDSWTDIIQVSAGGRHTVGLKADGTVVAVGPTGGQYDFGQCDLDGWTDIVQVSAGWYHTVGLMSDGTVIAAGLNDSNQCDVDTWTGICQISAGGYHTVGLKPDGTVVPAGLNNVGQCDVGAWDLD
jgi:hypothetical protein